MLLLFLIVYFNDLLDLYLLRIYLGGINWRCEKLKLDLDKMKALQELSKASMDVCYIHLPVDRKCTQSCLFCFWAELIALFTS